METGILWWIQSFSQHLFEMEIFEIEISCKIIRLYYLKEFDFSEDLKVSQNAVDNLICYFSVIYQRENTDLFDFGWD